jgi:putative IMPACT (imprinted ancient) family translation regulator
MTEGDESLKILSIGEAKVTVKRSRFLARVFPASSLEEALAEVKAAKGRVRKGRHHCWACRINDESGYFEQAKDDGEVGRPGTVLLQVLTRHDLEGGIIVSRIFGGVKLGVGGVSRAFREAAEEAVAGLKK